MLGSGAAEWFYILVKIEEKQHTYNYCSIHLRSTDRLHFFSTHSFTFHRVIVRRFCVERKWKLICIHWFYLLEMEEKVQFDGNIENWRKPFVVQTERNKKNKNSKRKICWNLVVNRLFFFFFFFIRFYFSKQRRVFLLDCLENLQKLHEKS